MDGAGAGYTVVFAVILGSGAGAGIAVNSRAHHGPNNSGGEWGHNPLPFPDTTEIPGKACYCGRHGCVETWLSGPGLQRDHAAVTGQSLAPELIAECAAQGDAACEASLQRYEDRLARALSVVINRIGIDTSTLRPSRSSTTSCTSPREAER